jgi:hypothetical protein
MIINVQAWCNDRCTIDDNENNIGYLGYVPNFLFIGKDTYGDAIRITIDVETGKILNWDAEKAKEWINSNLDEEPD